MVPRLTNELTTHHTTECLVETSSFENLTVKQLINQDDLLAKIFSIKKVKNNFLEALFLLKKTEINIRHGQVSEQYMIHVTGAAKVNSIIRNNFDWRRVTRSKFGKGTSFSKDAAYANGQANWNAGCNRAFIISRVLISSISEGFEDQIIPRNEVDTSVGNKGKVFVKFYDNEMLPTYVAFFRETSIERGNRPKFDLSKHDNLQVIPVLENKRRNSQNSRPGRNKRPTNKCFIPESNEFLSGMIKPRPSLHNSEQNRTRFDHKPKPVNNIISISEQSRNNTKINQRYVPSPNTIYRPGSDKILSQSNQRNIDWDKIYTSHNSSPNNTLTLPGSVALKDNQNKSAKKPRKRGGFISCCKSFAEFICCCCSRQA